MHDLVIQVLYILCILADFCVNFINLPAIYIENALCKANVDKFVRVNDLDYSTSVRDFVIKNNESPMNGNFQLLCDLINQPLFLRLVWYWPFIR